MVKSCSFIFVVLVALVGFCAANDYLSLKDINIEPLIVNGKPSTRGQFPFYALILINHENGRGACGGNLIDREWVLTAAHCVTGAKSFQVHLGALNLTDFTEPGRVIINATQAYAHPQYVPLIVWNDIALIRLNKPVNLSDTIQTISIDSDDLETNSKLTAIGFGLRNTTDTTLAPVLQHAQLQTISHLTCVKTFPFILFRRSVVCTVGAALESPCNGDSGGPLVRPNAANPRAPTLVGLTSFGTLKCHVGAPAVFTRVSSYTQWINKTIKNNSV